MEIEGEIVGSVTLFPANTDAYEVYVDELNYPEIPVLAIAKETRGKGVAITFVEECFQRTKEKRYDYIRLHTGSFMKGALNLYKRIGFKRLPQYDFEPANDGIIGKVFGRSL
jgi:ribosomal protein S18 acetylase RimI-like enzyme